MNEGGKVLPPSTIIREELAARGLTQTDLAIITGRYPTQISLYLSKEKISLEFAKELELVLEKPAEYWLQLENRYRLSTINDPDQGIQKRNSFLQDYPIKDMQKRGWIVKTDDFEKLTGEIEKFFAQGIDAEGLERSAFFKKTIKDSNLNPPEKAWLHRARHLAKMMPETRYNESKLPDLFNSLKKAVKSSQSISSIANLLQRYGIRFVVIEPLPRARIDGAAFWLDENSPVIALSIRFDNIGSFWFALIHELIHIKYRDGTSVDNFEVEAIDEKEKRANDEAAEFLVPQKDLERFIRLNKPYFSNHKIVDFATELKVHPGIIVGQLQHRKEIGFNAHHANMVKVRDMALMTAFTDGWGKPVPKVKFEEIK